MSTLKVTNIQDTAGGNSSTSEEIYSGRAKAWVNFDGTLVTNPGSATGIRADYNVNSITDNGPGDYTVTFTTAFADANYTMTSSSANTTPTMSIAHPELTATPFTASSATVETRRTDNGAALDCQFVCLSFFR